MVATMLKTKAQSKVKSNRIPAKEHTVTVPGPINAAVINGPGPKDDFCLGLLKRVSSRRLGIRLDFS